MSKQNLVIKSKENTKCFNNIEQYEVNCTINTESEFIIETEYDDQSFIDISAKSSTIFEELVDESVCIQASSNISTNSQDHIAYIYVKNATNKGCDILCDNYNNCFVQHKTSNNGISFWKCKFNSTKENCPVIVTKENGNFITKGLHNHSMLTNIIESNEDNKVSYIVHKNGSIKGNDILRDNLGNSYSFLRQSRKGKSWKCNKYYNGKACSGLVLQSLDNIFTLKKPHTIHYNRYQENSPQSVGLNLDLSNDEVNNVSDIKLDNFINDNITPMLNNTFHIVKNGSKHGKDLLYDDERNTYTIKQICADKTVWRCSKLSSDVNDKKRCIGIIHQTKEGFLLKRNHNHEIGPNSTVLKSLIYRLCKANVLKDVSKKVSCIVDETLKDFSDSGLPDRTRLVKTIQKFKLLYLAKYPELDLKRKMKSTEADAMTFIENNVLEGFKGMKADIEMKKKKYKKGFNELFDNNKNNIVRMNICAKKVPNIANPIPLTIRANLTNPIVDGETSVFLIVKDKKRGKYPYEPTIGYYKEMLEDCGALKHINQIIPMKQLKSEYADYEAKRNLSKLCDVMLCDDRVIRLVPKYLGKAFYSQRKNPVQVNLLRKDLKKEIERCLSLTHLHLKGTGVSSTMNIGKISHTETQILENVKSVIPKLKERYPGGWANIRSLHMQVIGSISVPIYFDIEKYSGEEVKHPLVKETTELQGKLGKQTVCITDKGTFIKKKRNLNKKLTEEATNEENTEETTQDESNEETTLEENTDITNEEKNNDQKQIKKKKKNKSKEPVVENKKKRKFNELESKSKKKMSTIDLEEEYLRKRMKLEESTMESMKNDLEIEGDSDDESEIEDVSDDESEVEDDDSEEEEDDDDDC